IRARNVTGVQTCALPIFLDIGRTLEYLETQGVPIIGYESDVFPSFFSRVSPYNVDFRIDQPEDIAAVLDKKWKLGLEGGVVIARSEERRVGKECRTRWAS